jgi:hypothetical protein
MEYTPWRVKISARTPNKIIMCGMNVMISVKICPIPGGAPGAPGAAPRRKKIVPITETIDVRTARMSAPHHGTSFAGCVGTVGGGFTVGGGVDILFLS